MICYYNNFLILSYYIYYLLTNVYDVNDKNNQKKKKNHTYYKLPINQSFLRFYNFKIYV